MHKTQFFLFLSTIWITFLAYSLNQNINWLYTKYYFLKAYSSANFLNTVLEILSVTFDTTFTYQFFEFETALSNSPKIVQRKKIYMKNVHMKTLNQHCPNFHISVSQFRACCSPNRNHLTDWFLLVSFLTTATHKHCKEHDLILYFHFLLSWQKPKS